MTRAKSSLANRLAMLAGGAFVAGMVVMATFPDFFHGLMDGLKG